MRTWFLPILPVMLVAVTFSIGVTSGKPRSAPQSVATEVELQALQQQADDALDSLRREINPHAVAAQYGK